MSSSVTDSRDSTLSVIGQVFPWDLADGAERAETWKELGVSDVAIALYYHAVRAVRWSDEGTPEMVTQSASALYLPSDDWPNQPLAPAAPTSGSPASGLHAVNVARGAGITPRAWLALTHRDGQSAADARYAVEDAWGNRSAHSLCPSHPEVRAFGGELLRQVNGLTGITDFLVESVASLGVDHFVAHDKLPFAWLDGTWLQALSLCFCTGCQTAGGRLGVDVAGSAGAIRSGFSSDHSLSDVAEHLRVARDLRRAIADEFLTELVAVANGMGARITVAATTDEWSFGAYSPVTVPANAEVTACAQLSAAGGRGWRDAQTWRDGGAPVVAGVVDMVPPATTLIEALGASIHEAPPIQFLDEIYLYHLGLRRPATLNGLRIDEAINDHRSMKGQQ